ncbi:hypothetical protein JCM19233_4440 [Vibrio astriarenae]|nr:hypothetical protein JCM19233_4440 [Vibrio sp. C7]
MVYTKCGSVVACDDKDEDQVVAGIVWLFSKGTSTVTVVIVNTGY